MEKTFKNEDQLQAHCFQWAHNILIKYQAPIWAVPNGGRRSIIEAQKLKATGVISGVHDVHLLFKGTLYTFEFKFGNNIMTSDQGRFAEKVTAQGGVWYEIRSFEQWQEIINNILAK